MSHPTFRALVAPMCRSCADSLNTRQQEFEELLASGMNTKQALDSLGVFTMCCRAHFISPDLHPRLGPGRLQLLERREAETQANLKRKIQSLLRDLGLKPTALSNPKYEELDNLSQWLGNALGQFPRAWGTHPEKDLSKRLEKLDDGLSIPEWLEADLNQLEELLQRIGLEPADLLPNEAFYLVQNASGLMRSGQLGVGEDLLVPERALELYKVASKELPVRLHRALKKRPLRPVKLFQPIEQKAVGDSFLVASTFNQIREITGRIFQSARSILPGSEYETIFSRVVQISDGKFSDEFADKFDRFYDLAEELKFPLHISGSLLTLQELFETKYQVILDPQASLQQILDTTTEEVSLNSKRVTADPIGFADTAFVIPPPEGERAVIRVIKISELGLVK